MWDREDCVHSQPLSTHKLQPIHAQQDTQGEKITYIHTYIQCVCVYKNIYICACLCVCVYTIRHIYFSAVQHEQRSFLTLYPSVVKNGACSHTCSEDKSKEM